MKNTYRKSIYLIALLLSFAVGTATAGQKPDTGPQTPDSPYMRLIDALGLDDSQAATVEAIFETAQLLHDEERAICYDNNQAIRDDTHAAVLAVLTEDQQALFEELTALREERWASDDRGNGGQGGKGSNGSKGGGSNGDGDCTDPKCDSDDCTNPDCPNTDG